jgi:hypothetical protein
MSGCTSSAKGQHSPVSMLGDVWYDSALRQRQCVSLTRDLTLSLVAFKAMPAFLEAQTHCKEIR